MGMPYENKAIIEAHAQDHVMTVKELMTVLSKANPDDLIIIRTDREPYGWFEITDAAVVKKTLTGWHWTNIWLNAEYHER